MVEVEPDALLGMRREQLEHPPRARADVEQPADRAVANQHLQQRLLDGRLADVKRVQRLELVGVLVR